MHIYHIKYIDPSRASPVYIRDMDLFTTVSADDLAPSGSRPSACAVMTTRLDAKLSQVHLAIADVSRFRWWHGVIQYCRRDPAKSCGTSSDRTCFRLRFTNSWPVVIWNFRKQIPTEMSRGISDSGNKIIWIYSQQNFANATTTVKL